MLKLIAIIIIIDINNMTRGEHLILKNCNKKSIKLMIRDTYFKLDPIFFDFAYSRDKIAYGEHKVSLQVHETSKSKFVNEADGFVFDEHVFVTKLKINDDSSRIIENAYNSKGKSKYIVKYHGCFVNKEKNSVYVINEFVLSADKKALDKSFRQKTFSERIQKYIELLGIVCELFENGYVTNINPYAWHYDIHGNQKIKYQNFIKINSPKLNEHSHGNENENDYQLFVEPFSQSDVKNGIVDNDHLCHFHLSESSYSVAMTILFFETDLSKILEIERFSLTLIGEWIELRPYTFKCNSDFTIECIRAVIDNIEGHQMLPNFDIEIDGVSPKEIILEIIDVYDPEYFDVSKKFNLMKLLKYKFTRMIELMAHSTPKTENDNI